MEKQVNAIKAELFRISWHMRGGCDYEHAMQLSRNEKELIGEMVQENFKTTQKTRMPFF